MVSVALVFYQWVSGSIHRVDTFNLCKLRISCGSRTMQLQSKKMIFMKDLKVIIENEGFSFACSRCRLNL